MGSNDGFNTKVMPGEAEGRGGALREVTRPTAPALGGAPRA